MLHSLPSGDAAKSLNMSSMINLVRPYGLQAFSGWVSSIGTLEGLPYTVQELENTICMTTNIACQQTLLANADRLGLSQKHQALAVRHSMPQ